MGVVTAVADRTNGGSDSGLSASYAEDYGGVLRSLVAVVDHHVRLYLAKDHIQGVCNQFRSQVVGDGP